MRFKVIRLPSVFIVEGFMFDKNQMIYVAKIRSSSIYLWTIQLDIYTKIIPVGL